MNLWMITLAMLSSTLCPVFLATLLQAALSTAASNFFPQESPEAPSASPQALQNAPHIFNAIHSSMRQWGSSLNHNGMSFFLAHMPAGTELYHGRGNAEPVKGMEWLAFEPEHAMNFAWNITFGPPRDGEGGLEEQGLPEDVSVKWLFSDPSMLFAAAAPIHEGSEDPDSGSPYRYHSEYQRFFKTSGNDGDKDPKRPRPPPGGRPIGISPGFLHTYMVLHDLRLLYVDGMAAAKTDMGTLETQDYILRILRPDDDSYPFSMDYIRALDLCALSQDRWSGRIDGFIRMEHGFELILCDFSKHTQLLRTTRPGPEDKNETTDALLLSLNMQFFQAIGARYDGIGGHRVTLDYDRMVSSFGYEIDLFPEKDIKDENQEIDPDLPHLKNVSVTDRTKILDDLTQTIHSATSSVDAQGQPLFSAGNDWQSVADMIVARYSNRLHDYAYGSSYPMKSSLDKSIMLSLRAFIDFDHRNATAEIDRCTSHFIIPPPSPTETPTLARTTITHISHLICKTLTEIGFPYPDEPSASAPAISLDEARQKLRDLIRDLNWTSWKKCRPSCTYDEFCFTAIWPFGDRIDHERPNCKNASEMENHLGRSYWSNGWIAEKFLG